MHDFSALLQRNHQSTTIVYSPPPKCIAYSPGSLLLAFLLANSITTFVVIDKIHVIAHFTQSFRDEFRLLKNIIFSSLLTRV